MKLHKGDTAFDLRGLPVYMIESFALASDGDPLTSPGSYFIALSRVPVQEILKLREKHPALIGRPTSFAEAAGKLQIWPTADKEYHGAIRYISVHEI